VVNEVLIKRPTQVPNGIEPSVELIQNNDSSVVL
jgi:hypothetical protein